MTGGIEVGFEIVKTGGTEIVMTGGVEIVRTGGIEIGDRETGQTIRSAVLLSVPFDGGFDFSDNADFSSQQLQPRVFDSVGHPSFSVETAPGLPLFTGTVAFTPTEFGAVFADVFSDPTDVAPEIAPFTDPVAATPPTSEYEKWADDHNLPAGMDLPGSDPDNDKQSNLEEFYFGGDPNTYDLPASLEIAVVPNAGGNGHDVILTFTRNSLARDEVPLGTARLPRAQRMEDGRDSRLDGKHHANLEPKRES